MNCLILRRLLSIPTLASSLQSTRKGGKPMNAETILVAFGDKDELPGGTWH